MFQHALWYYFLLLIVIKYLLCGKGHFKLKNKNKGQAKQRIIHTSMKFLLSEEDGCQGRNHIIGSFPQVSIWPKHCWLMFIKINVVFTTKAEISTKRDEMICWKSQLTVDKAALFPTVCIVCYHKGVVNWKEEIRMSGRLRLRDLVVFEVKGVSMSGKLKLYVVGTWACLSGRHESAVPRGRLVAGKDWSLETSLGGFV